MSTDAAAVAPKDDVVRQAILQLKLQVATAVILGGTVPISAYLFKSVNDQVRQNNHNLQELARVVQEHHEQGALRDEQLLSAINALQVGYDLRLSALERDEK